MQGHPEIENGFGDSVSSKDSGQVELRHCIIATVHFRLWVVKFLGSNRPKAALFLVSSTDKFIESLISDTPLSVSTSKLT